ncbi:MAG: MurR/RpiR family transcriptional regulator [Burkholderiales bacterium]|nr:MurR/RpiR family transcriptional regulator [Burkholderiales bacterium]
MSLHERVAGLGARLTAAERRLAAALGADPRRSAFFTTNELAQRARVDPATAVRFARKLGFDGYRALRVSLQQELLGASTSAERMRSRIRRIGTGSVLRTFVEAEIGSLKRMLEHVHDADIRPAARALAHASEIFLFAAGHAGALASLLESRLSRAGLHTRIMKHVAHDLAVDLMLARKGDAFILFALNSVPAPVPRIVAHARSVRASSILITDLTLPALRPAPDIVLSASRGPEGEPRSLSVPMALCQALVLHVSQLDEARALRNLERLDKLREDLEAVP